MEKKFFDIFAKYKPQQDKRDLLLRSHSFKFKYTKDPMVVEVDLSFDSHEDAELIYEIEDECRELYSAQVFILTTVKGSLYLSHSATTALSL